MIGIKQVFEIRTDGCIFKAELEKQFVEEEHLNKTIIKNLCKIKFGKK